MGSVFDKTLAIIQNAVIVCSNTLGFSFLSLSVCVIFYLFFNLRAASISVALNCTQFGHSVLISFFDTMVLIKSAEMMATAVALLLCPLSHQINSVLHHFSQASLY